MHVTRSSTSAASVDSMIMSQPPAPTTPEPSSAPERKETAIAGEYVVSDTSTRQDDLPSQDPAAPRKAWDFHPERFGQRYITHSIWETIPREEDVYYTAMGPSQRTFSMPSDPWPARPVRRAP